uniref:NADH-ubiquinone oxidoreductase chain 2 n=1 Tax=Eudarcia gwangneungensis TaxID=2716286 RepID=A0A6G7MZ15_9NEOP|nr:NADH dehydrogenase subunit 2 [Eudarcia gwangneungensis]QIJ46441.1 NADH dehydrogenase subunit 2 [Eudarcia gwangneungensis]
MNSNKMLFYFILFFSTMITISSNSWLGCWMGLEINLLSFIPIISYSNNILASESSLKYFLIQSIASMNFLFSIILNMIYFKYLEFNFYMSIMINSSLFMKLGSAPFHFWFPNIIEGLSWFNNLILMTWQKITPMILLSYYYNYYFLILSMILSTMFGALGGLNQSSLRKLFSFSSINHLGWMLAALLISENLLIFYFLIYFLMMSLMCILFNNLNLYFTHQLFLINLNNSIKIFILFNFLSLGGLPPFLGFFPKWIVINFLIQNNLFLMMFIFISMSLIILFFYIRIMYSSFLMNYFKIKWFNFFIKNKFQNLIMYFSYYSLFSLTFSTYIFYFF